MFRDPTAGDDDTILFLYTKKPLTLLNRSRYDNLCHYEVVITPLFERLQLLRGSRRHDNYIYSFLHVRKQILFVGANKMT